MNRWMMAVAGGLLASCAAKRIEPQGVATVDSALHREWKPANQQLVAGACAQLRTGDIALRTGADATSHMLRGMNQRDRTYSHCGIVVVEGGQPFVYHSIGGEDNPDARIRRDPAPVFFAPLSNEGGGVLRLPLSGAYVDRLVDTARAWYRQGRTFDMAFDLATDDALYCAEYVSKAVSRATGDTLAHSHLNGFEYIAVDNLTAARNAKIICSFRFQ